MRKVGTESGNRGIFDSGTMIFNALPAPSEIRKFLDSFQEGINYDFID